ncbi:MAG: hypothetical protein ABR592_12490 [Nitriliruptorales bacterium]
MSDRDETLLPLPAWTGVLEQLSLPIRAYRRQLMRSYEPVLQLGEELLRAYGGWMRYWERLVYWERFVTITGSSHDVSEWEFGEGTSAVATGTRAAERGGEVTLPGATLGPQLPSAGGTARSDAGGRVMRTSPPAQPQRSLEDLVAALEAVRTQLEQMTSSLIGMLEEQMRLLTSLASRPRQETPEEQ